MKHRTTRRTAGPRCAVAIAVAVALTSAGACASTPSDAQPPRPRRTTAGSTETLAADVQAALAAWASAGPGGAAVALATEDGSPPVLAAAGSAGPTGERLRPDSPFRVGSLTKSFVAVLALQLVEDGRLGLDDPVTRHLPGLAVADGVTVRQLLAHRSGIPEHTDGELAPAVLADPDRTWSPEEVVALVAGQGRDAEPGEAFAYSNTNYVVAGLLLERVAGATLADQLDQRIVEPLGLRSTYLAPDATREPVGGFSASLPGGSTRGGPYRALETAAGAAGALVSNASDLATFLRALAHGELLPSALYAEMTTGLPADGHTLGVFPSDPPTATGISNSGAIPGFTGFMQYDPATERLLVLLTNDDTRPPDELGDRLTTLLGGD